ncbi:molybdenum cofactor cytidylyltransferase [Paraclostridium bifermentans]|jgi:molybdenum cofactor cytidylyltransferase|uniref:molybdenum cofactor cytidylyltransferase n=1 Tax=Paraclostridium bifermentans TaxID=1490 RepID=UPI000DF79B2A|nr:molybdenum cofactor cytidylyltransferase [Paraclostridium bifermentans]MBU5286806.1 molybdenum cofactor cytidylyltransferase [Paraclostridium bifermentans]MDU3336554.1 molybdenum cofactor cytidylyltransferase [Paraclostridium bifermentans]RDC50892.1 molybdenum cofactor cytidylyltransferase [Acinetobacter sp. RIT592]
MISAIVMASGFSRRMGENKLLMDFNGKTIIENTFEALKKYDFKEVIVVSQYEEVLKIANKYQFKFVLNDNAHIGQSESIKLGIRNSGKCDGYMFFVGDQPLINNDDVKELINEFGENKEYIVIPRYDNKTGNPVIFPTCLKNNLLSLKNDEKGKKVINEYDKIKYVNVSEYTLLDVDTKLDYENLKKLKGN